VGADVAKTVNVSPKYQQIARVNQSNNRTEPKTSRLTEFGEIKSAERLPNTNSTRTSILNIDEGSAESGSITNSGENGTYLDRDENQNLILRFGQCLHPCRDKGECKHPCCKYGIKNNRRKVDESGDVEERPNKRQKTEQGFGAGTNDSELKSPQQAPNDYLFTLRAKATNLSTNGNMRLLKGDNSTKDIAPVKVPSYIQSFAWQGSTVNHRNTTVNPSKATPNSSSNAPQAIIPEVKHQVPARTFKFLGREIALPSVTPERTFFAPSRFMTGHSNDNNVRNEFEFEL
jgi:hypothetical protein